MVNKRAFTLIELLLTMAIFAVVSLAVYSTFSQGLKVWKRANQMNIGERKVLLKVEKLARQIRQAFNHKDIALLGEKEKIAFPQVVNYEIVRLTYAFDAGSQEIMLASERLSDIIKEEEKKDTPELKFQSYLAKVENLSFSYLVYDIQEKSFIWKDEWTDKKLPLAVKINLTINGKIQTSTIFIPVA